MRHGNITIADNVLSDVGINVEIHHARAVTITGNTIWKGYERNLIVQDSKNIVLTGNVFDRNPRYHYGDGDQAKLGLLFRDCQDATLSGNHISGVIDHEAALEIHACSRFNITGNSILDYGKTGILLDQVVFSRVSDCLIRDDRPGAKGFSIRTSDVKDIDIADNQESHRLINVRQQQE